MRKYEYEIYSTATRGNQIFTGDCEKYDEIHDDSKWRDMAQETLVDAVWAESEEEAVRAVADDYKLNPNSLYAVQRVANAALAENDAGIEAYAFREDGKAGIHVGTRKIYANSFAQEIFLETENGELTACGADSEPLYCVLHWNDRCLRLSMAAPACSKKEAQKRMRQEVLKTLVRMQIAADTADAERIYAVAETGRYGSENDGVSATETGACIYWNGYEDRYEVTEYPCIAATDE